MISYVIRVTLNTPQVTRPRFKCESAHLNENVLNANAFELNANAKPGPTPHLDGNATFD